MYYSLVHWRSVVSEPFQIEIQKLYPDFFIPGKDECFLKVPDTHTAYVFETLMAKYDVMIMDCHGKPYMYLDDKGKKFHQR